MTLYEVLGVSKTATDKQIKTRYRKLAIKYHPDKNSSKDAEELFKKIADAYSILSDPEKRKMYDQLGEKFRDIQDVDPVELFKDLFERDVQVPNVEHPVKLSMKDLYFGCETEVEIERYSLCKKCKGNGTQDGQPHPCKECEGHGEKFITVEINEGGDEDEIITEKCEKCSGKGIEVGIKLCKKCHGNICHKHKHVITVDVPPGAYSGYVITCKNEGNSIPKNERLFKEIKRSDVEIIIDEIPHKKFKRGLYFADIDRKNPADMLYELKLTWIESICGFKKKIKHLSGKKIDIVCKIPVQNGDYVVMKKKGMPCVDSSKHGDLFIKIKVERPELKRGDINKIWQLMEGTPYPPVSTMKTSKSLVHFEQYEAEYKN